jgi:hypothetical protein
MKKIFLIALLAGASLSSQQAFAQSACDVTINPGTNAGSQIATAAANGAIATICLNSGSYGAVPLYDISRSTYVTIQSVSGQTASIAPQVGASKFLRFSNLMFSGFMLVNSCSTNIQFVNSTFPGYTEGLAIDASSCPGTVHNYLVDGVSFPNTGRATWEGRLSLRAVNGMTIRNSTFSGAWGASGADGVQVIGGSQNVMIGPNNLFDNIRQSLCTDGAHCDSIQFYGAGSNNVVEGNRFKNSDTFIMAPDGTSSLTIRNNVFDATGVDYAFGLQFGSANNIVFSHNTLIGNAGLGFGNKSGESASQNCKAENNLFRDNARIYENNCIGTVLVRSNMFSSSSNASGTSNLIASPVFVGGTNPTTLAGFQLASGSPGKNAGNDGKDMGTNYYGGAVIDPPPTTTTTSTTTTSTIRATTTSTTARATTTTTTTSTTLSVPPSGSGQSVFSTQVPQTLSNSDGAGVNYELGLRFTPTTAGQIRSIRFYKSASESGSHTGKIYSANGQLLASVVFANESASGWQVQNLATPLNVVANTEYTVSVNTGNTYYVATTNGLSSGITSGSLRTPIGGGVYGPLGSKPTQTWQNSNYFRDVVFVPNPIGQSLLTSQVPQLLSNTDGPNVNYELGMRFTTTTAGQVKAIRFYKAVQETGTHTGKIYSASGQLLASVVFSSESGSGWQVQNLNTPLTIAANTEYTVAVNTGNTFYVATNNGLATQITNGSLRSIGGGVFGPVGAKPTQSWQSSNYFRDVVFAPF